MWKYGIINGFEYEVKVYDTGSQYGINGGRISKLWLRGPEGANDSGSGKGGPSDHRKIQIIKGPGSGLF